MARRWRRSVSTSAPACSAAWACGRFRRGFASKLEDGAVVAVPGEHGRRTAIRAPAFGELAQLLLRRLVLQAHQPAELDLYGKVAGREHVRPPFREQQIDLRRP